MQQCCIWCRKLYICNIGVNTNLMKGSLINSNSVGAVASALCLLHCLLTPVLFIAHVGHVGDHHASSPTWWKMVDLFFLLVSFFAVYKSSKTTSKKWMVYSLWATWIALFIVIMNEKIELFHIPEYVMYIIAMSLVILHLYNQLFCQCVKNNFVEKAYKYMAF